ncbi:MAG: alanine acetyltransferase [Alteromonas sp.]|nr:alanine acetyltransferase [Alteromonas sp.]|tara:strand:+ start:139 stop:645 length:507 start_codon:yes stop_codon:yes gene_type:complete
MAFTQYQQAVLQEMGIQVWISKEAYLDKSATNERKAANSTFGANPVGPIDAKPVSQQEKQSRLAQLRAQVESKETSPKPKPSVTDSPQQGIPLSAEQKRDSAQWLSDLTLACVQIGLSSSLVNIVIDTSLRVDANAIRLPALPHKLSPAQKKALWHTLVSASQSKGHA